MSGWWSAVLVLLSGCAAALPAAVDGQATQAAADAPAASAAVTDDYTLGVADKVRITVFNESTLTGEYPVNANGRISMPLIGEVQAAGLTAGGLRRNIERALADGFLINPRVAIDVLTFRPFYILGEVTKPGEYPSTAGLSVVNAVAVAQGFTYRANKKYVFLKRKGDTEEHRVRLTSDLKVMPGDTIRVGERFF